MYRRNIIKKWINEGEGSKLDFKLDISSPSKIARTIVAFANGHGGKIVVGVEDNGRIIGTYPDGEEFTLEKAAREFCDLPIPLEFERYETDGKMLLIATVAESNEKPHYAIDKKGRRKLYVRIADECVVPGGLIANTIKSGDLNLPLRDLRQYDLLKREIAGYLYDYGKLTISDYMRLRNRSERSARRSLLDLLLDGFLAMPEEGMFVLARKGS